MLLEARRDSDRRASAVVCDRRYLEAMTTTLVSAAARTVAAPRTARRIPLATRAAAQHAGPSAILARITAATADTVPSASAFQSAL